MVKKLKYFFIVIAILGLVSCILVFGGYFQESENVANIYTPTEELGETVYYFDWVENKWYKEYVLFTDDNGEVLDKDTELGQAITSEMTETSLTIINYDESQEYLMKILIKDDGTDNDFGIPDQVVVNSIYLEDLDSNHIVKLENGETIRRILHIDLSRDFEFKEDGTPLGEVAVAYNLETIVNTFILCGRYGIDAVDFYFDGEKLDSIGGVSVYDYWVATICEEDIETK